MRKILILAALVAALVSVACDSQKKPPPEVGVRPQLQEPITDQGIDAAVARVQLAADFLLKYAEKHGKFPEAETAKELKEKLRPEFGHEPGFEECWVSHNGKVWLQYMGHVVGGKAPSEIPNPSNQKLIWDPINIKPHGRATAYVDGTAKAINEAPTAG